MKKPYEKPTVSKIEVSNRIARMFYKDMFIELFWDDLKSARRVDPKVSEETVFNRMNEEWFMVFNRFRYSSYDSFRQRLNK